MVITCDNVCELLLMERRVTGKPSCTVRGGGKAGNVDTVGLPIAIRYREMAWLGKQYLY